MGHVFISYSRHDTQIMQRVRDDLRGHGLELWTDEAMQPGNPSWQDTIEEAIENAGCIVVILSPHAKKSRWVREEMRYAEAQNVRIFPILAEGSAKRSVPFGFLTAQWVDIRQESDYMPTIKRLAGTIRFHLGLESINEDQRNRTGVNLDTNTVRAVGEKTPTREVPNPLFPPDISKAIMVLQNRENKWWRRVDAINHLGELRDVRVKGVLEAYLDDDDLDVQAAARRALNLIEAHETRESTAVQQESTFDTIPFANRDRPVEKEAPAADVKTLKLMVTGPDALLREQFIRTISEVEVLSRRSNQPDLVQREVNMSFGQISVTDELVVYLFGTPGRRRFIAVWDILTEGMLGSVIVIDSAEPNAFYQVRSVVQAIENEHHGLPCVIAAANRDALHAWRIEDMRRALRLSDEVPLLACDIHDSEQVKEVLLELIYRLPVDVDTGE